MLQALVVLQGKSREVIIRELQRTGLNVNEAVNNLLSREDDDGEGESYIPEELVNLLDSSFDHPSVIIDTDSVYSDEVRGLVLVCLYSLFVGASALVYSWGSFRYCSGILNFAVKI